MKAPPANLYPNGDAIGHVIDAGGNHARIVGTIPDVHLTSVEGQPDSQVYYPHAQQDTEGAYLVIRSKLPPEQLASASCTHCVRSIPAQAAVPLLPIQSFVDHAVSPRRFFVLLVGTFAALGLFLAALGIYGVISYSVTRRTLEIGIRMALGASALRVQFGVIFRTMRLALIGIAVGAVCRSSSPRSSPPCSSTPRPPTPPPSPSWSRCSSSSPPRRLHPRAPRLTRQPHGRPARQLSSSLPELHAGEATPANGHDRMPQRHGPLRVGTPARCCAIPPCRIPG